MSVGSRCQQMPYAAPNGLRFSSSPPPRVRMSAPRQRHVGTSQAPKDPSSRSVPQRSCGQILAARQGDCRRWCRAQPWQMHLSPRLSPQRGPELDSGICGRSPRRIISSAPGCPVLSRRSACRSPATATAAPSSLRLTRATHCDGTWRGWCSRSPRRNIYPNRQALDANRRRAVEVELQQADAEILAHLGNAGEQPGPVRLEIAQGRDCRSHAAWVRIPGS
jgi:hypothetical protein